MKLPDTSFAIYSVSGIKISNNVFYEEGGEGIFVRPVDGIVCNNTIIGGRYGIRGRGNISFNIIKEASVAILLGSNNEPTDAFIFGNLLEQNGRAFWLFYSAIDYILNNTIKANGVGFEITNYAFSNEFGGEIMPKAIMFNNFLQNDENVRVLKEDPRITINMTYNWWGTTNTSIIDQKIYDQKDDRRLCLVNYTSFLTSPAVSPDIAPPTTLNDYDGLWHNSDFTITLMSTDNESGIAETYYRINNGPVMAVSSEGQPCISTEGSNNTLEYWSVDNGDNEELPHKILTNIKLDKTQPTIQDISRIPQGDVQPDQPVTVLVNATDTLSDVKSVRIAYKSNRSILRLDFPMTLNSTTGLYEYTISGEQANTLIEYEIEAYDNAGNQIVDNNARQYYTYTIIPEFPSLIILPLFMTATLLTVIAYKRKYTH